MASEVVMPQLGLTMTEGTVVKWLKKPGETVKKGEPLFEVETDKVTQEVGSLDEGVLGQIVVAEGTPVPIGTVIAYLGVPGEASSKPPLPPEEVAPQIPPLPLGEGRGEGVSSQPAPQEFIRSSPAARKLAARLGVEIATLKGSGPGGRIIEEDVRRAAEAGKAAPAPRFAEPAVVAPTPPVPAPTPAAQAGGERVELKGIRKVVAERMAMSFSTAPHFYLTVEVDAGNLATLRQQIVGGIQRRFGVELTVTDLLVKAVALALREHPEANASWDNGALRMNREVNVGVAAAVEEGLVVPVIAGADGLTLGQIAQRRKALVEKSRAGRLALADLEGGSFTITNLGMFGIDQFQAIVNPPQAGILAVGRIKDRVVAVNGQVAVRPTMFVTLSNDHRVMDGAVGARFLARVVELLENPTEMLLAEA